MIYNTPNWPYDLTEVQQAEEERAINAEIQENFTRLAKEIHADAMKTINSTRQWWDES